MTDKVPIITPSYTLADTHSFISKHIKQLETIHCIYVVDSDKKLMGVFSIKDLYRFPPETKVEKIYKKSPLLILPCSFFSINLLNPLNGAEFDACSLYTLPTFQWNTSGTYRSIEIQFSGDGFITIPVRVRVSPSVSEYLMNFSLWRRVLLIPGVSGGTVSWKVVGTRLDNSKIESGVCCLFIGG